MIQKSSKDPNQLISKKRHQFNLLRNSSVFRKLKENSLLSSVRSFIINPFLGCSVNRIFGPDICRSVREREPVWYRVGCAGRQSDCGHSTECCTRTCDTRYDAVVKGCHRWKNIFCRIMALNIPWIIFLFEEKIIPSWIFFYSKKK